LIKTNDVIFATVRPTLKRIAIVEKEFDKQVCSTGYFVFRTKKVLHNRLLFYFLLSDNFNREMEKLQKGASYPAVTDSEVRNQVISFPKSLPEQHRIVAILDEAFVSIAKEKANAEQNLKNSKELFKSYLDAVFTKKGKGWEKKTLGEIVQYDKSRNVQNGLPYVGLEHIESNSGRFIGILKPQKVKSSTFYFSNKHVLYGRLRPYLNKVLLPDFEGHCSTEIFPIKVNEKLTREYLFYWLISGSTVKKIDATWTGTRMPRANMNTVLNFDFYLPPLLEQQTIISKFKAFSTETKKLEVIYQQKLNDLEELKKSILQKAFNGCLNYDSCDSYDYNEKQK
jgi:type I restriction enzyme S subunit